MTLGVANHGPAHQRRPLPLAPGRAARRPSLRSTHAPAPALPVSLPPTPGVLQGVQWYTYSPETHMVVLGFGSSGAKLQVSGGRAKAGGRCSARGRPWAWPGPANLGATMCCAASPPPRLQTRLARLLMLAAPATCRMTRSASRAGQHRRARGAWAGLQRALQRSSRRPCALTSPAVRPAAPPWHTLPDRPSSSARQAP